MLEKILNKLGCIKKPVLAGSKRAKTDDVNRLMQKIIDLKSNNRLQTDSLLMFMREREHYGEEMERLADMEDANRLLKLEVKGLRRVNKKYKQQFSGMQAKIDRQASRLGDK